MRNPGYMLLLVLCCVWPLISATIGIWAYKRWQRYGLGSFFPHFGRRVER